MILFRYLTPEWMVHWILLSSLQPREYYANAQIAYYIQLWGHV